MGEPKAARFAKAAMGGREQGTADRDRNRDRDRNSDRVRVRDREMREAMRPEAKCRNLKEFTVHVQPILINSSPQPVISK